MGSLAAGGAAVLGTGANPSTSARRTAEVSIKSDATAYLGLKANDPAYAKTDGTDKLYLDFSGDNGQGGYGLNQNADQIFDNLFQMINQGTKDIWVGVLPDPSTYPPGIKEVSTYTENDSNAYTTSPGNSGLDYVTDHSSSGGPVGTYMDATGPVPTVGPGVQDGHPILEPGDSLLVSVDFDTGNGKIAGKQFKLEAVGVTVSGPRDNSGWTPPSGQP